MKKRIISAGIFILLSLQTFPFGLSQVFDPVNWYTAIDSLYGIYDQIKTNIEQLKVQYESFQQALEAAKGWDFDKIQWDGDFDIRNELESATASVNRQLTNIRNMQNSLTQKNIRIGRESFSIADLVGAGDPNKTAWDFAETGAKWTKEKQLDRIKRAFEGKASEAEKMAVMNKFGISIGNYMLVKNAKDQIKSQIGKIVAMNSEAGSEQWLKGQQMMYGPIFAEALGSNATPQQVQQAVLMHQKLIAENLNLLNSNLLQIGEMLAWKIRQNELEEDAKKERNKIIKKGIEARVGVSPMFKGGNSLRKNRQ